MLSSTAATMITRHTSRNGSKYVIGFANLQRDITFGVVVEKSHPGRMPTWPASNC